MRRTWYRVTCASVERYPVTLLALATDLHPQRAVVVLQDVLSAHDELALPLMHQNPVCPSEVSAGPRLFAIDNEAKYSRKQGLRVDFRLVAIVRDRCRTVAAARSSAEVNLDAEFPHT